MGLDAAIDDYLDHVATERGLTPFVGRERELVTLTDLLAQATEGRGQVVGIVGEPGVGSRACVMSFSVAPWRICG